MEVEQTEPLSCEACGLEVRDTRMTRARWYTYSDPTGWCEWGQICGACLRESWRSMDRIRDETMENPSDCSHGEWKKRIFEKVIRRRLRHPPTTGIEEEVRALEHYELKHPVDPDEWEDWQDWPSRLG